MPITASTLRDVEKELSGLRLKNLVKAACNNNGISVAQLSKQLGRQRNFLTYALKTNDVSIYLLLAITAHTRMNILEPYITMLPDELQETERERQLKKQVADLQEELERMKKERDLLKEIVMK